ncbi:MAG: hydrogenase nickel incorporation protein HypB [Acidobacteriota bacterium]|nr:hydrogenase nickel incorporation protein HypB [Acidobacteriota bacterium]
MSRTIKLDQPVLAEHLRRADHLRRTFRRNGVAVLNLVSSPGAGKTTLLERTIEALSPRLAIAVIAGDVQTQIDADRARAAGARWAGPVETNGTCHLEPWMIEDRIADLDLAAIDLLFIENVGNLVCPAVYDLGEHHKAVMLSTVEGDDKPLKYPVMFRNASTMIINKTDLLGLTDFQIDRAEENARRINPDLVIFKLSCKTGEGLTAWFDRLLEMANSLLPHKTQGNPE